MLRDISEVSLAEAKYQQLFEAAPDAVVIVDSAGAVTLVNAAAEQLFGHPRDDLLGQSADVLLPDHPVEIYRKSSDEVPSHDGDSLADDDGHRADRSAQGRNGLPRRRQRRPDPYRGRRPGNPVDP